MTSPISSPQNIFAIQEMGRGGNSVSWLSWFAVALPIAFIGNLVCWGALLAVYRPNKRLKEVRRLPDTTVSPSFEDLPPCSCQTLSCLVVMKLGSRGISRTAGLHSLCLCFACSLTDSRHLSTVQCGGCLVRFTRQGDNVMVVTCAGPHHMEAGVCHIHYPRHGRAVVRQLSAR